LAAQAASSATVSAKCSLSQEVLSVVLMTSETSGDSRPGVSGIIFRRIQDSFTTQGSETPPGDPSRIAHLRVNRSRQRSRNPMPPIALGWFT
jgi:hypothetical protein